MNLKKTFPLVDTATPKGNKSAAVMVMKTIINYQTTTKIIMHSKKIKQLFGRHSGRFFYTPRLLEVYFVAD